MRIEVNDDYKILSLWFSNEEKETQDASKNIESLIKEYKTKKYIIAIYKSGQQNLRSLTKQLISQNYY